MKYIKFTYVDSTTNKSADSGFLVNGPKFPEIDGLEFKWEKLSKHPTSTPEFFGTCSDSANTDIDGVLDILSKEQYDLLYSEEMILQNRDKEPQVITAKQIRLRLLDMGLLDKVNATIAELPTELQIEWNYDTEFNKTGDVIVNLTKKLELMPNKLNEIFMSDQEYLDLKESESRKQLIEKGEL